MSTKASSRHSYRPKLSKKDILQIIFYLFWAALSLIISQFIIALPMLWILGNRINQPLWTCIYYALNYLLALFLVIYIPPKLSPLCQKIFKKPAPRKKSSATSNQVAVPAINPTELGVNQWPTFVDIGLAPIGYFVYIILANLATNLMKIFPWFDATQTQEVGFSYFITSFDRIIAMIALVFIAPIAEELIMRGWLYGKLRTKLKYIWATLLTSFVFALLHGQWNVGVSVFMLSLVLCSLREITGSIWSGVLLHMLSNGIAFYVLYVAGF